MEKPLNKDFWQYDMFDDVDESYSFLFPDDSWKILYEERKLKDG